MNLPNRLTLFRIILIPLIVLLYLFPYAQVGIEVPSYMVAGVSISLINMINLVIYIIAAITDAIDGHYARKHHMITTFGKFADPIGAMMGFMGLNAAQQSGGINVNELYKQSSSWLCPNCQITNEGKFCSNCGTKKPE